MALRHPDPVLHGLGEGVNLAWRRFANPAIPPQRVCARATATAGRVFM
jgi:hypothetical protein